MIQFFYQYVIAMFFCHIFSALQSSDELIDYKVIICWVFWFSRFLQESDCNHWLKAVQSVLQSDSSSLLQDNHSRLEHSQGSSQFTVKLYLYSLSHLWRESSGILCQFILCMLMWIESPHRLNWFSLSSLVWLNCKEISCLNSATTRHKRKKASSRRLF